MPNGFSFFSPHFSLSFILPSCLAGGGGGGVVYVVVVVKIFQEFVLVCVCAPVCSLDFSGISLLIH